MAGRGTWSQSAAYFQAEDCVLAGHEDVYKRQPEKFNNKTNGITFRRWLLHCNPELAGLVRSLIGGGFEKDAMELEKLLTYRDDQETLEKLEKVKRKNKKKLRRYLYETQNLDAVSYTHLDVYKRQAL